MKKLVRNIGKHKVITCSILAVLLVGGIGVGAALNLNQNDKEQLKEKAIESLNNGDNINSEEMKELATGEEIVKDNGETVVLTQDENGNVVETVVKDAQGNSTGAVVPQNHNDSGVTPHSSDPQPQPSPQPAPQGHTHTWVAHYATRQVPQTSQVNHPAITHNESHTFCCVCHADVSSATVYNSHPCNNGMFNTTQKIVQIVDQAAWVETITTYTNEQYVDYYYCSECGARQ